MRGAAPARISSGQGARKLVPIPLMRKIHPMTPSDLAILLEHQHIFPFHILNTEHREEAAKALEIHPLDKGQALSIEGKASNVTVYLLRGRIKVAQVDAPAEWMSGVMQHPVATAREGLAVRVTADESSLLALVDSDFVDDLLFWDQTGRFAVDLCVECGQRMQQVKNCSAFRNLPLELFPDLVQRLKSRQVSAGEEVVRQGEPGEAFYLLSKGRAEVWEHDAYDPGLQKVNEMGPGDSFGEQAIIMGGTRSATVRMVEEGELLVLSATDYRALVADPGLREIDAGQVPDLLKDGHRLLDVRYEEENEESRIPNSQLLPLQRLRQRREELDPSTPYVVYCRSGKRSAVAAMLMEQFGIEAVSLRGGILDWPGHTESDW